MEQKTKISAEAGKQDLLITREFDLPVELLFKAYAEPDIIEQWMGTNVVFQANGVIHEFNPNKKIVRTFEMENAPFGIQLEVLEFEKLTDDTSKLNIHAIYESVALRDQMLKLPFAQGINMAHDRLQEIVSKSK